MRTSCFPPRGAVLATFLAATLWLAGPSRFAEAELLGLPVSAPPSVAAPDVLLRTLTAEVLAILKRDAEAGDVTKISELVEAKILPFFDFAQMTKIAMGRNWSAASPEQQSALVAQFRTLLVRTYSLSLVSYRDQVVEYLPLHAGAGDTDVTVRSTVKRPGVERLSIDYDMEKTRAGWTVYDVKVAGVSLVVTYRASFAAEIRENGVSGLIKVLTERNRQNESRAGAGKA
jgi:phospholipid transport system substrate-binding protein